MRNQIRTTISVVLATVSGLAWAFDSGSTGADGALAPNVDTTVALPSDGVLNYSSIDIPVGVTVRFERNTLNTPVTLLVSGDVNVFGSINLSGEHAADSFGAGSGNVADDGLPGLGGPGGFPGGRGGEPDPSVAAGSPRIAMAGIGPGGGRPQTGVLNNLSNCWGGGGSFATLGATSSNSACGNATPAPTYGSVDILPLVGGSGGAGGNGADGLGGSGGGGGGGALLLAVSGTLTVTGSILANGGHGGDIGQNFASAGTGTVGGGGSGGSIRLVATNITGNGTISALGARTGSYINVPTRGSAGDGRIRLEAESNTRTAQTTPPFTSATPGLLAVAGLPTLRITSVAGVAAPAEPTGSADIVLPSGTPNPVEVVVETSNVPLGNTVGVIVTPPQGAPLTVISTALAGAPEMATATASINLIDGPSVLLATLSYAVSGQSQAALSRFTEGEPVVAVELAASVQGETRTVLITESGRRVLL